MIAAAIGAGIGALTPIIMEIARDKPDPAAAKTLIESKRAEMVDMKVGAGLQRQKAEQQVDAEIQAAMDEADRQGSFNFPGGEMIAGAILGGLTGGIGNAAWGKLKGVKGAATAAVPGAAAASKSPVAKEVAASAVGDADDIAKAALPPGAVPAIGSAKPVSMAAPNPTGMPFPNMTTKGELAQEFAGMPAVRGVETAAADVVSAPFPAMRRGPQTVYDEFGFSPRMTEPEFRREFQLGNDVDLADAVGRAARLRRPIGD